MRCDYYDHRPNLIPVVKKRKKKRKKGPALPVFLASLALVCGGVLLSIALRGEMIPPYFLEEEEIEALIDPPKTSIRRMTPPGVNTLTLQEIGGDELDATEIYARVHKAILSVQTSNEQGPAGEGTGVIFDPKGYFITNYHVIEGMSSVTVTLYDGQEYPARLVGMDGESDLAVLYFPGKDLTAAPFARDAGLRIGERVYALGNPLGHRFQGSLTDGILSGINRNVTVGKYDMSLLQTSAPINPGNSGGALLNRYGQVIGIVNSKMAATWVTPVEGLGFAIPTSTVERVVEKLMIDGEVPERPMLGITVRPARVPEESPMAGLYLNGVNRRSNAWEQGLRSGDILLTANGVPLKENQDLLTQLKGLRAGDRISVTFLKQGEGSPQSAEVMLMTQEALDQPNP